MAQFDVFRNPGRERETIPFVIVLQNARYDRSSTRFVAALVLNSMAKVTEHSLAPQFTINGIAVVMDVFNLATISAERLDKPVATLTDEESRSKLIRALDEFISQA